MRSVSIVFTVAYTNAASMNMHGVLSEHVEEPVTPFHITNMPILWKAVFCCIGADCIEIVRSPGEVVCLLFAPQRYQPGEIG